MPKRGSLPLLLALLAPLVGACTTSSVAPAPTPQDFGSLSRTLQARGITIVDVVSGDPGCSDANLARTAIHFQASGLDQAAPTPVYLYIFGDRTAYERRAGDVAKCAASYVAAGSDLESVDVSPYVLAGPGPWAASFRDALRAGLTAGAGDGGTGGGGEGMP